MYVFVWGIMEFNKKSTGLSLGNLVDGLPGALLSESLPSRGVNRRIGVFSMTKNNEAYNWSFLRVEN